MKKIKTIDAIGHVLCHDITQIIKDVKAGVLFQKGHIVKEEDVEPLLLAGKDHLYIYEIDESTIHENDAAEILYSVCANGNMEATAVKEGKIEVVAREDGLLKVDIERLRLINGLGEIIIATRHMNTVVKKGDKLAAMRVVPLIINKSKLDEVSKIGNNQPLLEIQPFNQFKVGVITTGNEIYYKRIEDTFTPVIVNKLAEYGLEINYHKVVSDDLEMIKDTIKECKESGAELIICTGGMSVDPDDLTPTAIKESGANLLTYGTPVLPGAMLLLAYFDDGTPIMGLPGCVMYANATSFDLFLPRVIAKNVITREEIASLGHGGLCLRCQVCRYPQCGFSRGN